MPDSFLVVALGLDPRVQGKRRSGRPGCSARGPSMTGKEAVRGDEESQLHLPAGREVAGGEGDGVAVGEEADQHEGVEGDTQGRAVLRSEESGGGEGCDRKGKTRGG